jgi:hypothetical protein
MDLECRVGDIGEVIIAGLVIVGEVAVSAPAPLERC